MSSNNNVLLSLLGLSVCIMAIQKYMKSNEVVENFAGGMPSFVPISQRVAVQKGQMYEVPPSYQSNLSPRISGNVDYGANIRYSMPSQDKQALNPLNPLTYGNIITEGYCANNNCGTTGQGCNSNVGNQKAAQANMLSQNSQPIEVTNMLPVQSMKSGMPVDALGQIQNQPIIYDRIIYANKKSPLQAAGDPIRGDLPIVPNYSNWFNVAARPQTDLRTGALAAMGGFDMTSSKEMAALQSASSAGLIDTSSGVQFAVGQSSFQGPGASHLQVTSFP